MTSSRLIVYAPTFDADRGGSILLHKLCFVLNNLGYKAFLWPWGKKNGYSLSNLKRKKKSFHLSSDYPVPLAHPYRLYKNDVVIYPEVIKGNPLNHSKIVRWFLHKPGYHTGVVEYGKGELYFFFDDHSNEPSINPDPHNKLSLLALHPAYKNRGYVRSGSCYLIRKGEGKPFVHVLDGSIKIDGMNHEEIAEVFNKTKYFYSYDEMTMYSIFAALCGCISIVIPESYSTRDDWVANHPIAKYGIAYGLNDIDHAVNTQFKVEEYFLKKEEESIKEVKAFVEKVRSFFNT